MNDTSEQIREIAQAKKDLPGALLPILHSIQDEFGYLPKDTVTVVAGVLNLSKAEVHGVVTFYHFFRETPPGKKTLFICRSEACQAMGANQLIRHAKNKLGVDFHQTTHDGGVSLEPIYCLGNCACAPAVMIDDQLHGRVNEDMLDKLIKS